MLQMLRIVQFANLCFPCLPLKIIFDCLGSEMLFVLELEKKVQSDSIRGKL